MIDPPEDRRPAITPQLALRVAILGGLALALFAIVFFRLWFLQVLTGDQYLATASDNQLREIRIAAPRGDIVDRQGRTLVDNRVSIAVQVNPDRLPEDRDEQRSVLRRLGKVIGASTKDIQREIARQRALLPYANVTVKADAPDAVYKYLLERQDEFPGVAVDRVYLRHYPRKELAAQLFGTVGEISPEQLESDRFRGVEQGTIVGKDGIEAAYDRYLRGRDGATKIQIDSLGRPKREFGRRDPIQGRQIRLSLDIDLQRAGEQAMGEAGVALTATPGSVKRGAFVALDPRNGEVLAMGSYPSFDPNVFSKPVPESLFKRLNSREYGAPLVNRAIAGTYPTGSTFKLITATAALESGLITPGTIIDDPGSVMIGNIRFNNAGNAVNGAINVVQALKVSSDVFFYKLGQQANGQRGNVIQTWAKRLGVGRESGIDIPGEFEGLIPTPEWRNRLLKRKLTDRPWSVGDNVNLSVGQGDLQATPLQMAVAYSTIANGGRVVRPHVGLQVEDSAGRVLQEIEPGAARRVDISDETRSTILDGLRKAAGEEGGTSADVFRGFPQVIYGKTGTAERFPYEDQSWYVAYAPSDSGKRPIVIAATVEQGGFGAEAAAPVVRYMLSEWFGLKKKFVVGTSHTR